MSKLRRALSMRRKASYTTLDPAKEHDFFSTPTYKLTPVKELGHKQGTYNKMKEGDCERTGTRTPQAHFSTNKENTHRSTSKFLRLTTKLKRERKVKRKVLRDSPYKMNEAYTTPRRSQRIAERNEYGDTPVISLKMYSPFCIETPGSSVDAEASFTCIRETRTRKTPKGDKTPNPPHRKGTSRRSQVRQALNEHKELANSLSGTSLATTSGY